MFTLKVWLLWIAIGYIALKLFKHRRGYKKLLLKYGAVFMAGAIMSTPLTTMYNVTHPHEAVILASEVGFKAMKLKRKARNVERIARSYTPSYMKKTYNLAEMKYDKFIRPNHNHAAKTFNMFGARLNVPKEGIFMRWTKSLKHVLTLGPF